MTEIDEIGKRRSELSAFLTRQAESHQRAAGRYNFLSSLSFYIAMIFGGLAVALGLVKFVPVPSEVISICAAIGTGATLFGREAKFRARADWFYTVRDAAEHLKNKLEFELPIPVTAADIAAVSEEWNATRSKLGEKMFTINNPETKEPSRS